jgi:hypothetical protein
MAIGRISGSVLKSNLTRNGTDLAFETNLLYLDVTNTRVGIGTSSPSALLDINGTVNATTVTAGTLTASGTGTSALLTLTTTEASNSASPIIALKRNSGSPADQDKLGQLSFLGENDNDQEVEYGRIYSTIFDASDGTEDGKIQVQVMKAGTLSNSMRFESEGIFLNTSNTIIFEGGTADNYETTLTVVDPTADRTVSLPNATGTVAVYASDGSNGQVLQTDGAGTLSFAESGGGGGGNNTAVKQFNYYKLTTTSAVIDEFDLGEFRGAIYDIGIEETTNNFIGHVKVSIVHNDSTPFITVHNVNEDSTRIVDFTAAISGDMLQLSAATNSSSHTNLRIHRVALGDHHETVANTNSKIIATSSAIGSTATTLDQFTKTDIQGAKYIILIKDSTQGDYQISEMSMTHNGTTVFHDDYAKVSTRTAYGYTFSAAISSATVTLSGASTVGTTGTAILYRQDLGSKTKLGEVDNHLYGKKSDMDSTVETVDSFDVFKYKTARYLINIGNSGSTEYQNSEIVMTVNAAGTDATISESLLYTGNNSLATFTADVSGGKARLRASCSTNSVIYFARLGMEAENIYRANAQTSDDLYITHNNIKLEPGAITLPTGSTASRPSTSVVGMLRYNTDTSTYERYDSSGWTSIATTAATSESDDTTTGETTSISTSATNIDTWTSSSYDSGFYLAVTRDEINDEVATDQISLVHNNTTAFVASGGGVRSGSNQQITYTADIQSSTVRLRATGTSDVNSVKWFRIGLGDSTTAATTGNVATVLNSDVDSAVENIDTWAKGSYRGAKYYISANNTGKTELQNIECVVVHNGTDAFITTYNDVYTGNDPLITLTADISSNDVRLRATGNEANTGVKMYRILLSDTESDSSGTNTGVVGATTVSSSATALDTFSTDSYTGVHYIVTGYNSGESGTPASISEVFVVSDGSGAYVSHGPDVSTKGTGQLTFTAALSGTTVTLSAASTSGGSTTVNAYRTHIKRVAAGASTSLQVLTTNAQTISGAKTHTGHVTLNDSVKLKVGTGGDLEIYHDGNNSYIDDAGTGTIFYRSGTQTFMNAAGTKTMATFNAATSVDLNYNNNTKFQTTNTGVSLTGVMAMAVESGDPSGVANNAHIYAKDDSASAEVYVRDEAGNVTKLSPHNKQGEWEYFSRNTKTGKTVRVNMEEMIKDIEKLTGKKYIKEE